MTVFIRKIDHSDHEYFAYTKSLSGKGTYSLYFMDDIWGALTLNNFIEMQRKQFQPDSITVDVQDKTITLKNDFLLSVLRENA